MPDRRADILEFIIAHTQEHGFPPTLREIAHACGISSQGLVYYHIEKLAAEGHITRDERLHRSVRVVEGRA